MSVATNCPQILPLLINKLFLRLEESFAQKKQTECKSIRGLREEKSTVECTVYSNNLVCYFLALCPT